MGLSVKPFVFSEKAARPLPIGSRGRSRSWERRRWEFCFRCGTPFTICGGIAHSEKRFKLPGYPAILFIGVRDNGMPEVGVNLEKLQQSFTLKMQAAYPPIYFTTRILEKDGAQFLAVIVPGSPSRPHFAGQAYVRKGNRTEAASEQEFEELLASRLSKSAEILKWITKTVTLTWLRTENTHVLGSVISEAPVFVTACNSFYVTYADQVGRTGNSIPLRRVEVSYDNANSRLKLEIYPA